MRIENLYHTGLVVSDLERAVSFYTETLGLKIERPVSEMSGEWIANVVGFESATLRMAYVGAGGGHSFELIQYVDPPGDRERNKKPRNDVGAAHVGMIVDDIHAWYERLVAAGMHVARPPTLREADYPWARYAIYFQDPDSNWLEMVERGPRPPGSTEN